MAGPSAKPIDASTRICAVYGCPISHSASPAMHNAGLAALGLNWRYVAYAVRPENLRAAIDGAKAMGFVGLNLTVPHKIMAVEMMDALDESARLWGAVNTVRFETQANGKIRSHGFNTDADAITRALREDLKFAARGGSVLLLGAGGAGRVAAIKLAQEGVAELYLVNRTVSKAEELAEEIKRISPAVRAHVGYPKGDVDLVMNATKLGLEGTDPLPFDPERFSFSRARAAYDMIYSPPETPFLQAAKAAGCRATNGASMLLYQGAKAFELWTGQIAPIDIMREALLQKIYG